MIPPVPHPREAERLALLRQCDILDTAAEPEFDGLVALASSLAGAPIALVGLIDEHRQWLKGSCGLEISEAPRELTFCAHTIVSPDPMVVVEDARQDPRFAGNPFVTTPSGGVIFYVGIPLNIGPQRLPLGTLCVIDHAPRQLAPETLTQLQILARQVEVLIEMRLRRRELEEALAAKERAEPKAILLAKVAAQVPGMVYQFVQRPDGSSYFPYSSPGISEIYGCTPEAVALSAEPVLDRLHPDDRNAVLASVAASAATLARWGCEYRYCHPDGRTIWLHGNATPERCADGAVLWHGFITDITEHKQSQAIIEREQARFRHLVDGATGYGIFMLDRDGNVQSWNPGAQRIKGYRAEEIIGRHFSCFYPPETQDMCARELNDARQYGRYEDTGWRVRKDGSRFWANVVITPILTNDGALLGFTKITRDISERLEAEESAALLQAIFHAAGHAIIATNPQGIITVFNAAAERMLGWRADAVIGKATPELIHLREELAARAAELSRELGTPITPGFEVLICKPTRLRVADEHEWTYRRKDGSTFPVQLSLTAIRNPDDSIRGYIAIASDLTARRQADSQIRILQDHLQDAIESLDAGFVMYDADEKLVLSNRRYQELYHIPAEALIPGTSYETVIRQSITRDPEYFRHVIGDLSSEQWLAKRMAVIRSTTSALHLQQLGEQWVQVNERRSRSGGYISLRTDITELKRMEAMSRQQAELMRLATTAAGIAVWVLEVASGTLIWDDRMCEMYGYSRAEFPDTYAAWRARVHPDDLAPTEALIAQSLAGATNLSGAFRIILADGEVRHIAAHAAVTRDASGKVLTLTGVNLDITEQVTREERLQQILGALEISTTEAVAARQLAESASRAKAEFLATMSHEIRTPMNGVIGMTSLLLHTKLSGEQREYVDSIRLSGDALLMLINDILDFSKIEAGKLALEPIHFDLRSTLEDVFDLLDATAADKGIDLLLDYPVRLASRLVGDEGRIRQILLNLVSNAVKFTLHGAVVVTVEELGRSADGIGMRLTVSDSGIGMTAEQVARLFQPFIQADASTSRRFGGTGLGLAICGRLTELMHGTIGATSEPGVGSRFTVELTLAPGTATGRDERMQLRGQPVVLIGDRQPGRTVLARTLASLGMVVGEAADAAGAAPLLAQHAGPTLVLLDQHSAGEAVMLLAALHLAPHHLPVLLTGRGERGDTERMADAGFRAYLTRPLRLETLRQALGATLAQQSGGLVTRHSVSGGPALPDQRALERHWRVLLAEDNSINQKVAGRLLELLGCMVDVAANGAEAVKLAESAAYDLILMDCQMPDMDGFAATRAIRAGHGPCRSTIIVALTANAMQQDREECMASGMNDHLAKPITSQALKATLQQWLGNAPVADPNDAAARCRGLLAELTRELGDPDIVRAVVQAFISDAPRYREALTRGTTQGDPAGLERVLHSVRGSALSVGLTTLAQLCQPAEAVCRAGRVPELAEVERQFQSEVDDLQAWLVAGAAG